MTSREYGRVACNAYFGKEARKGDEEARWVLVAKAVLEALVQELKDQNRKPKKKIGMS